MEYPIMKVHAMDVCETDWVEGDGPVVEVAHYSTLTFLRFAHDQRLVPPRSSVWVRIEDHGQTA
jgi:hypothetical protein